MEEKKIELSVIDTIKKYSIPEYSESTYGNNAIVSYGPDNDTPILLRNCYRNSATLKAIIDGYIPYILGDEIIVSDKIAQFRTRINSAGMTMRQFIASLSLDYLTYGGFAFQVIYSKMGTVAELWPLDFARCRTNERGTKIFYSKKGWTKYGTKSEEYEPLNPDKLQKTAIFYFKGDFTKSVYPLPSWYGALNDVLTEIETTKYSLNSVSNGFQAKFIVNLPNAGNLTQEQKQVIEDAIREKFTGTETSSNFMLYFSNTDKALTVSKVEGDDLPERYIAIRNNSRSNIFTALHATPNLFGLPTETTGFNSQEYSDAFKLFNKTVITPIQDIVIEAVDKVFVKTLNGEHSIEIKPFVINFDNEQ